MDDIEKPEDGDFVIFDSGPLGSRTSVSIVGWRFLGEFKTRAQAEMAIRERAEKDGFFPSVWYQDDHGGLTPQSFRYFPVQKKARGRFGMYADA